MNMDESMKNLNKKIEELTKKLNKDIIDQIKEKKEIFIKKMNMISWQIDNIKNNNVDEIINMINHFDFEKYEQKKNISKNPQDSWNENFETENSENESLKSESSEGKNLKN